MTSIDDVLLSMGLSSSLGTIIFIFILGFIIGLGYFGGLWLTLKKLPDSSHPYRLMIGSFILRLMITLCCFYGLIYLFRNVETGIILFIAVLGFIVARLILTQKIIT
ncbi:N-ATPase subunit AtpR [Crocosphaera sp.]|uniref:N-ATPase subunit AtpR n=1 Tax=Crocosphaera sp. TaxID=2729996 RepID=UPI003F27A0BB|nr:ATP synthase subunit I [Crocosphaera sp.]